ncbi:MAG: signal peptidase I [Sandaracinaceae bacterium]
MSVFSDYRLARASGAAVALFVFAGGGWAGFPKPITAPRYGRSFSLFDWYRVQLAHDGMAPTLLSGDRVLVHGRAPMTGDIALCVHPNGEEYVLARVLAAGRHSVWTDGRGLQVQNETSRVQRSYPTTVLRELTYHDRPARLATVDRPYGALDAVSDTIRVLDVPDGLAIERVHVPPNHVYLLGDNRTTPEYDSRSFGAVPIDGCVGTVEYRYAAADDDTGNFAHERGGVR